LPIDGVEIDRLFQSRQYSEWLFHLLQPHVRKRHPVADPSRSELLALEQSTENSIVVDLQHEGCPMREIVQQCLATGRRTGPVQLAAINRIGRSINCTVTCSPLKSNGAGEGAVLLMEEVYRD